MGRSGSVAPLADGVGVTGPQAGNLLSAEAAPQVRAAFGRLEQASMGMLGVRQFRRLIVIPAGS
jgi:serine/threonine protein phosphatase PrpC